LNMTIDDIVPDAPVQSIEFFAEHEQFRKKKISKGTSKENESDDDYEEFDDEFFTWGEQYEKLIVFEATYLHCVPEIVDDACPSLKKWVKEQRCVKHQLQAHQIEKLDKLGFCWSVNAGRSEKSWIEQYEKVAELMNTTGAFVTSCKKLRRWMQVQKQAFQTGELYRGRQERLKSINFQFDHTNTFQIRKCCDFSSGEANLNANAKPKQMRIHPAEPEPQGKKRNHAAKDTSVTAAISMAPSFAKKARKALQEPIKEFAARIQHTRGVLQSTNPSQEKIVKNCKYFHPQAPDQSRKLNKQATAATMDTPPSTDPVATLMPLIFKLRVLKVDDTCLDDCLAVLQGLFTVEPLKQGNAFIRLSSFPLQLREALNGKSDDVLKSQIGLCVFILKLVSSKSSEDPFVVLAPRILRLKALNVGDTCFSDCCSFLQQVIGTSDESNNRMYGSEFSRLLWLALDLRTALADPNHECHGTLEDCKIFLNCALDL